MQIKAFVADTLAFNGQTAATSVLEGTFVDRDGDLVPDAINGVTIPGFQEGGFMTLVTKFQVRDDPTPPSLRVFLSVYVFQRGAPQHLIRL